MTCTRLWDSPSPLHLGGRVSLVENRRGMQDLGNLGSFRQRSGNQQHGYLDCGWPHLWPGGDEHAFCGHRRAACRGDLGTLGGANSCATVSRQQRVKW